MTRTSESASCGNQLSESRKLASVFAISARTLLLRYRQSVSHRACGVSVRPPVSGGVLCARTHSRHHTALLAEGDQCARMPFGSSVPQARHSLPYFSPMSLRSSGKRWLPWVSRVPFGASYGGLRAMIVCSCAAHVFETDRRSASGERIGCAAPHRSCREAQFSLRQCNLRSKGNGHETRLYDGYRWSRTRHELVPLAVQRGPLRCWPALDAAGWAGGGSVRMGRSRAGSPRSREAVPPVVS